MPWYAAVGSVGTYQADIGDWLALPGHSDIHDWLALPGHSDIGHWLALPGHSDIGHWLALPGHKSADITETVIGPCTHTVHLSCSLYFIHRQKQVRFNRYPVSAQ